MSGEPGPVWKPVRSSQRSGAHDPADVPAEAAGASVPRRGGAQVRPILHKHEGSVHTAVQTSLFGTAGEK